MCKDFCFLDRKRSPHSWHSREIPTGGGEEGAGEEWLEDDEDDDDDDDEELDLELEELEEDEEDEEELEDVPSFWGRTGAPL